MKWVLSQFRAGDLVEVRSKEEILGTLDEFGCLDGMPFMPEMVRYCGQRFRVRAVAHKTCETAQKTFQARKLDATVHLDDLRCDGSAHGGCEAGCSLFWRDEWLKMVGTADGGEPRGAATPADREEGTVNQAEFLTNTRQPGTAGGDEPRYSCQATRLYAASKPLAWWNPRQYVLDVLTGNHSVLGVLRSLWLASMRWLTWRVPVGYRVARWVTERMYRGMAKRSMPTVNGRIKRGERTPTGRLSLVPGEYVRVKSQAEIEETLDEYGHNRGLSFDPEEMAPLCGRVFRVQRSVTRILDETTGKMLHMKQPCIVLDGGDCTGVYASCRLNCPRAIPGYWREIWLERVDSEQTNHEGGACSVAEGREDRRRMFPLSQKS